MIGIGALLVWILAYVAIQGLQALDWGFLTDTPPGNPSDAGGGFYNGIIGSLIIVGHRDPARGPDRHRSRRSTSTSTPTGRFAGVAAASSPT